MIDRILSAQMVQIDPMQLIEQVEVFYNNAWDKLVIFVSIIFIVLGVILPIILQRLQKRSFNLEKEDIKKELKEYVDLLGKNVSLSIDKRFEEENKILEEDFKVRMEGNRAETNRLHAIHYVNLGDWESAAIWWSRAIGAFFYAKQEELVTVAVKGTGDALTKCVEISKSAHEEIRKYLAYIPNTLWLEKSIIEEKLEELKKI